MNKLVYAVEKLIRKTDRQNGTTQCSKCFYLFCNSTNLTEHLTSARAGIKVCSESCGLHTKTRKTSRRRQQAARQGFGGILLQGLHQISRLGEDACRGNSLCWAWRSVLGWEKLDMRHWLDAEAYTELEVD